MKKKIVGLLLTAIFTLSMTSVALAASFMWR